MSSKGGTLLHAIGFPCSLEFLIQMVGGRDTKCIITKRYVNLPLTSRDRGQTCRISYLKYNGSTLMSTFVSPREIFQFRRFFLKPCRLALWRCPIHKCQSHLLTADDRNPFLGPSNRSSPNPEPLTGTIAKDFDHLVRRVLYRHKCVTWIAISATRNLYISLSYRQNLH